MKLKTDLPEVRAEAVKRVLAQGLTLDQAAQRIGILKGMRAEIRSDRRLPPIFTLSPWLMKCTKIDLPNFNKQVSLSSESLR